MKQVPEIVIVTTSFYQVVDEMRMQLALKTVLAARAMGYPIIMVDGSTEPVKALLRANGATVHDQTESGMGASRRQVLTHGLATEANVIIWLEPEKYPLVPLLEQSIALVEAGADIVLPTRKSLDSLPTYQAWSETLANEDLRYITGLTFDFMFGPRVMSRKGAELLLSYTGEPGKDSWHILFLPIINALVSGMKLEQVVVNYVHPPEQTAAEEGDKAMDAKRDKQRLELVSAMKEQAEKLGFKP